jgi:Beta-xylosidase
MAFSPENYQQMAGLIMYYDTRDYVYLRVTFHEELGTCIGIIQSIDGVYDEILDQDIPLREEGPFRLKVTIQREKAQFMYAVKDGEWTVIGPELDVSHLSDEYADYIRFTGNFIGMCVQDLSGERQHADFDYFRYEELD